jgi:hypothetical protein
MEKQPKGEKFKTRAKESLIFVGRRYVEGLRATRYVFRHPSRAITQDPRETLEAIRSPRKK